MGTLSIWHWLIVIVMFASPIIRGVQNSSVLNALLSVFIPIYGLIYFFAAKQAKAGVGA
jgi:hypothetical protein